MSWNELSLRDKADYIKESVNNGIYNLSDIRNRYNMYANGGYKPSESIKKRITNWEGSSMRTNRSFQAEANDFNRVIPSSIRSKLSQQQLDALYSYGYNVGMGNLKKRVLPTLTNYVQGKASNEDVQKSMWASKDNELRGLTTRRNTERSLFGGNYQTVFTGTGGTPHNYGYTATTNRSSSNPYQIQNEKWQGKNYLGAYKGLQLSMNDIMGKTKETDINDLFSAGIGPTISMDNLLSIGNNNVAPVQPDYSYAKSLLSDFDSDLNSNMFDEGGNLNFIDADNRRSNILLHTEDGNLYDSAGNNYTQSYLDEEHVPIIKGTMPRNTRQYYDPNTTLEFINAVTAPISNFSPSNIVGSIREARDYNTFMNSFMNQDNTGFFTREYAEEHPYISTLGNLGGDILAGATFDKGIDILRDFKANSLLYKKGLTKLRSLSKKLGYRPNFNRYNNNILYDYTYGYSTIGNLADRMTENLANKNKDLFYIQKRLGSDSELQGLKDYYAKYATRLTDTQKEAISRRYGDKAVQLMSDNPEYFKFIRENPTLNPFEQSTVDAFFRRQGLSLRGVHSNNPIQAQKFLTETEYGRVMPGGDRLNTNGGLYTSNSRDIGNRFKNPEVGTEDGYIAELFHDWGIDKSLPIEEQLYQQRQKVLYDLAHTKGPKGILYPLNPSVNSKAYTKLRENPVLEAIESEYMRSSGETLAANERAYLPIKGIEGTKGKPVNIEKVDFYPSQENQRGRWGSGNIDDTLFINKELNNTTDFIRDARILLSNVPVKNKEQFEKAFKEINERMSKRVDKYEQLRDKVSKIQDKFNDAKLVTIGLSGVPLTAAGTYGIYKYDTNNNLEVIEHELRVDDRYHRMNKIARKDFEDAYKRISGKDWKVK